MEAHAPGFHVPAVRSAGVVSSTTTPLLVVPANPATDTPTAVVHGSAHILRWVDEQSSSGVAKLYPADKEQDVCALCARFDTSLGVAVRLWVYSLSLDSDAISNALAPPTVPSHERVLWHWCGVNRVVRAMMRRGMRVSAENGAAALEEVRAEFNRVGQLLADGRPFLLGEAFTAADLTFAALAAPALNIPYGEFPPFRECQPPKEALPVFKELRATPAGRFAIKMWDQERTRVVA